MSTAKQIVMNDLLNISDDVQDEFEVLEGLYKSIKLEKAENLQLIMERYHQMRLEPIFRRSIRKMRCLHEGALYDNL